eukprot:18558-Heterococcus_DN1.PRE.1
MAQTLYMACSRYHADIIDQRAVIAENTQQRHSDINSSAGSNSSKSTDLLHRGVLQCSYQLWAHHCLSGFMQTQPAKAAGAKGEHQATAGQQCAVVPPTDYSVGSCMR